MHVEKLSLRPALMLQIFWRRGSGLLQPVRADIMVVNYLGGFGFFFSSSGFK